MSALENRVVLMSGGSRGIGLAIAKKVAAEGAKVAILAKTDQPHPKLPGTIHTAAAEIEEAGGEALAMLGDVRNDENVAAAVAQTVERFGGIDIVVNNASAITLAPMRDLEPKRYDLMLDINARGTFVLTRAALPHLRESDHAHVLTLSPPLSADPKWLPGHAAYTVSKMGMTMITLGLGRGRGRRPDSRELPVAAHHDRHRRGEEPARRGRGDEAFAHARDLRRRRRRDPAPPAGRVHGQRLHRRRGAGRGGHHRPRPATQRRPDADLALDIFVDGWPE